MKLAVIADDLTGANDTGVQFARQNLKTTVLFSETKLQPDHLKDDVIVLSSDSRALTPEKAYESVFQLSDSLKQLNVSKIYKKIDSTMRGNIGSEIDAVMDAFHFKLALVVPAFPKGKRETIDGYHYVNGKRLEETEIARDPVTPVKESYLPKLLQEQTKRTVGLLSITDVRKGKGHLSEKMKEFSSDQSSKVIIIDATTDEELQTIVEATEGVNENFLWVGSAGIASHLFNQDQDEENIKTIQLEDRPPVLIVAGSVNPVVDKQIKVLKEKNRINEIIISPEEFFYEDRRKLEMERIVREGQAILEKGDLVVTTNREQKAIKRIKELQQQLGLSPFQSGKIIAESMGSIAGELIKTKSISGTVLTGGDIAGATCKVLNSEGIRVIGEVESGIPYGKLFGGLFDGMPIVTKAGAFGTEQALSKALETIVQVYAHKNSKTNV
ncbi:four-carbon acid sugar kinase family protein [Niallia sp. XMNu-256]|uniref:four-carbon acid sugar kinase family protein n=1 Tax=Niallia sp. XMNu-256 TaxID=3082444 RepID=UPI0030CE8F54